MGRARGGVVQFPGSLQRYSVEAGWTLFKVTMAGEDRLELTPVLPGDDAEIAEEFRSSLTAEGQLWIPAALRERISLGEQSVMMRAENGGISIYLRKVFETLGFRP